MKKESIAYIGIVLIVFFAGALLGANLSPVEDVPDEPDDPTIEPDNQCNCSCCCCHLTGNKQLQCHCVDNYGTSNAVYYCLLRHFPSVSNNWFWAQGYTTVCYCK